MHTINPSYEERLRRMLANPADAFGLPGAVLAASVMVSAFYDIHLAAGILLLGLAIAGRDRRLIFRVRDGGGGGPTETARTLGLLPKGFTVVHNVSLPPLSVDHVVVGPTGVWVVDTASYGGLVEESATTVNLGGRPLSPDPRQQSRATAAAIARHLRQGTGKDWSVEGLLCLPNATAVNGYARRACVVGPGQLLSRIRLAPAQLGIDERRRVIDELRRATKAPAGTLLRQAP